MFISVDDTDSRSGGCTTFLMTEIIRELEDLDVIGNPHLVRLNPAVPWKTRGNASLSIRVGKGCGDVKTIGKISGRDVVCYASSSGEPDRKELFERLVPVVEGNRQKDSESCLIVSSERPSPQLYLMGVRTIIEKETAEKELKRISADVYVAGGGRGMIGAACGMAWNPDGLAGNACGRAINDDQTYDFTYELTAYRARERWGTERYADPQSIRKMDSLFPGTFNSWEERWQKVTMVPSTPCPVLYGIRGDDEKELTSSMSVIRSEEADRWIVFRSNQGTDDHIITEYDELVADRSYLIRGTVTEKARRIRGGHVFVETATEYGNVTLGAYEPSKEFRMLFDHLLPGDSFEAMGELRDRPRTLNVEKIHITGMSENDVKVANPLCPSCGKHMKSVGSGKGYRCRGCRTASDSPVTERRTRRIVPGWYEPPAAARRHLSKPLKRMGIEQPIDFVNSRIT